MRCRPSRRGGLHVPGCRRARPRQAHPLVMLAFGGVASLLLFGFMLQARDLGQMPEHTHTHRVRSMHWGLRTVVLILQLFRAELPGGQGRLRKAVVSPRIGMAHSCRQDVPLAHAAPAKSTMSQAAHSTRRQPIARGLATARCLERPSAVQHRHSWRRGQAPRSRGCLVLAPLDDAPGVLRCS